MDAFSAYTIATAGWLSLQAVPLIFTPSVLLPLLHASAEENPSTVYAVPDLAIYLSQSLGFALIALSVISLLLSGRIPLSSFKEADTNPAAAFAGPITVVTTLLHFFTAFHAYSYYADNSLTMYALGLGGSGFLAAFGIWTSLFGDSTGHISRRTGKDKRVSGWPFGDKKGRVSNLKQT